MTIRIPALLTLAAFTALSGAALVPSPVAAQCVPGPGLTGYWRGNDQGDYYIRQVGTKVWWVGMDSTTNGRGWTHAYHGWRGGNNITGSWADVRGNVGVGMMNLVIDGHVMTRGYSSNPNFGGSRWVKRCG